jgi:hypothetical protein
MPQHPMKLDHQEARHLHRHPLSAAFPDMPADELQALVDDIEVGGQRVPIMLFDGMVLDGWHRLQACLRLLMPVVCQTLPEDIDPRRWVISQNVSRRHLNASQRALALAACHRYEWTPRGNPTWGAPGITVTAPSASPALDAHNPAPEAELRISDSQMAAMADVGIRTIQRARVVLMDGSDEIQAAVRSGRMSLNAAVKSARPRAAARKRIAAPAADARGDSADNDTEAGGVGAAELLDEMRRDLDLAESRARDVLALMDADPETASLAAMTRRAHHAERRQGELMEDAAKAKKAADFYQRQLARCGKAVGQRELGRVAAAVEAFVRNTRQAAPAASST